MRSTRRAALVAGGIAILGLAVTPAVAAIYHRPPAVGPTTVMTQTRGDEGASDEVDGAGPMADVMRRGGPQMFAMHRAHHGGGAVGSGEMRAMHRAHHGGESAAGKGMMGSRGAVGSGEMRAMDRAHHGGDAAADDDMMGSGGAGDDMMGGGRTG